MHDAIRQRIEAAAGVADLVEVLSQKISTADLQSLMLEVYSRRAAELTPAEVLKTYEHSRFVGPSHLDLTSMLRLQVSLLEKLPASYVPVLTSPLAPLGACSALATVHQNKVVSTARGHEVCADPTNSLALEAAPRRRRGSSVRLATIQRVVRAQTLPPGPGFYAHFSLFGMAAAGRWSAEFAEESLVEQWSYVADLFPDVCVRWTDLSGGKLEGLYRRVEARLANRVRFEPDPERASGRNYYVGGCFKVYVDGSEVGDGGFTDWTQKLLSDRREAFLILGLGLDRVLGLGDARGTGGQAEQSPNTSSARVGQ